MTCGYMTTTSNMAWTWLTISNKMKLQFSIYLFLCPPNGSSFAASNTHQNQSPVVGRVARIQFVKCPFYAGWGRTDKDPESDQPAGRVGAESAMSPLHKISQKSWGHYSEYLAQACTIRGVTDVFPSHALSIWFAASLSCPNECPLGTCFFRIK
jgi:hypothetical protein